MDVAKRLDTLIERSGLSNQAVADAARVSDETISRWRHGTSKKGPSLEQAISLARRLGTTVEYLATGREPVPTELTEDERIILTVVRDLKIDRAEALRRLYGIPVSDDSSTDYARPIGKADMTEQARREFKGPQSKRRVASTKGPSRSTDHDGSDDSSDLSQSAKDTHR